MVVSIILITLYFAFLLMLIAGWSVRANSPGNDHQHVISVIVPIRNEYQNLSNLIGNIRNQTYSKFEVIVVDDHSDDGGAAIISAMGLPKVKVIKNEGIGKKSAITSGVKSAIGDIIITTDADCQFHAQWIEVINSYFNERTQMVTGAVKFLNGNTFFQKLQQMEFASLIGSSASLANLQSPIMCNGANLAYRRAAFFNVNGYEGNNHIASGDDEFLMRKFVKEYEGSTIRFMRNQKGTVTTTSSSSVHAFVNQRRRWASKWKDNTSWMARIVAVSIFGFQLCWLTSLCLLIVNFSEILLIFMIGKVVLESILLVFYCRFLEIRFNVGVFLSLQLIYPIYVVYIAASANFFNYSWKDRQYSPSL
jgi:poly-beta-1,6-N-acetyl-D-glucosamine synthase